MNFACGRLKRSKLLQHLRTTFRRMIKSHKPKNIGLTSGAGILTSSVFFPSRYTLKIGRGLYCEKKCIEKQGRRFTSQKAARIDTAYLLTQLCFIKIWSQNLSFMFAISSYCKTFPCKCFMRKEMHLMLDLKDGHFNFSELLWTLFFRIKTPQGTFNIWIQVMFFCM